MNAEAKLIAIDPEPIPGTHLHRRFQDQAEVGPEYQGPVSTNELAAIEEASTHGYSAVRYAGRAYARFSGTWYVLNWAGRQAAS